MTQNPQQTELRSILTSTKVGEVALTTRPRLKSSNTIADAVSAMRDQRHGCALVCDGNRLVGIFTERDLLRALAAGRDVKTALSDVMTNHPKTVSMDDTLFEATRMMDSGGYRRLPVVDGSGCPAGLLDVKSIVHFLVDHFPAAVYNQASHAQLIAKDREGA